MDHALVKEIKEKNSSNIFNGSVFCFDLFLLSRLQMVCFILLHTTDIKDFFFSYFLSKKNGCIYLLSPCGGVCVCKVKKEKEIKVRLPKWYTFFLNKENVENSTFFSTHPRM